MISTLKQAFREIKRLYFPRWDHQNVWRVTTRSPRRRVHGHCDPERRVIAIVALLLVPDERDRILIHEICHAVADVSHGKKWQRRMKKAAGKADDLGRLRLSRFLRDEIVAYQQANGSAVSHAYDQIRDAVWQNPDLTLQQIKRWLADEYGLLVSEVCTTFRRARTVLNEARRDAQRKRDLRQAWLNDKTLGKTSAVVLSG